MKKDFFLVPQPKMAVAKQQRNLDEAPVQSAYRSTLSVLVIFICSLTSTAFAQLNITNLHRSTTTESQARFEIVQSQLAAKWTFRLDRYTGRVHQLVKTGDNRATWEQMLVKEIPKIERPNRPRFVIFTSGLAARHTFLMDSDTGRTWRLGTVSYPSSGDNPIDVIGWWPFAP